MRGKPDLNSFIGGGAADVAELKGIIKAPVRQAGEGRITKSIRITKTLDMKLKEEAYKSTMSGCRTSESDLIEAALLKYFNI